MAKSGERRLFGEPRQFPAPLDEGQIVSRIERASGLMQSVESEYVGRKRIVVPVTTTRPIDLILWGDLHLLSLSTDADEIDRTIAWILSNPYAALVLMGDELEGIKREYERTNRSVATYQQQEDVLAYKIRPIAQNGQLITFLRDYWGHIGWPDTGKNSDPWLRLSREWNVPELQNGGQLAFQWKDGRVWETLLWHNPPGSSKVDPVGGLKEVALNTEVSRRVRVYASAHLHREGTAVEIQPGDETGRMFVAVGTNKGSNPDLPADGFGVRIAKGFKPTSKAGQGLTIYRTRDDHDGGLRGTFFSNLSQGELLGEALRIADDAMSRKLDKEIVGKLLAAKPRPKLRVEQSGSVVSTSPYFEEGDVRGNDKEVDGDSEEDDNVVAEAEYSAAHETLIVPPYEKLRLRPNDVSSPWAVMVHSNIRAGSSSEGIKELREFREKNVVDNPLVLELWGRNLLDKDAGMRPNRMETLDEVVELLRESDGRSIGVILDDSMRRKNWLRKVGKTKEVVIPATYLAENAGVALLQNQSIVEIVLGRDLVYAIGVVDKLMNSGSTSNSTFGLLQMYAKHMSTKPAVLVGGHMPVAGWEAFEDGQNRFADYPVVIQPGSYAKTFDGLGGGNRAKGSKPGQGFFMMPGKKQADALVVPFGDESSFADLSRALILYDEIVTKNKYPKYRKDLERAGIIAR